MKNFAAMLHVGAQKEAIVAARSAVMEILKAPCEDATKRVALETFAKICEVKNATISHCTFTNKG